MSIESLGSNAVETLFADKSSDGIGAVLERLHVPLQISGAARICQSDQIGRKIVSGINMILITSIKKAA